MPELEYDIIVAGGGTAGSAAAVAAARRGCKVLLVEEQNCLGGVSTAGGVGEWFASLDGMGDIFDRMVRELDNYGARFSEKRLFNPEYLKLAWQDLADRSDVEILFHSSVVGVERQDRVVKVVRITGCSRDLTARAKYFIDASGEGDMAALAGAEFMLGDPQNHLTLHMTLVAWLYDTGNPVKPYLPEGLEPINSPADLPGLGSGYFYNKQRVYLNVTKVVRHDPTDPMCLSLAEREARRQLIRILHYIQRTKYQTFALGGTGSTIGIREGRRVVGEYVLSQSDILDRPEPAAFDDGIAVATSQIDFHSLAKQGNSGWRQKVQPYNIPFRCLIARGFANLLTAGKCISADQVVHSSCRMTPTCCAMGQAAGTAVAMAIEDGIADIHNLPVASLRAVLTADGIELDPRKHNPFAPHDTRLDKDDQFPT